jgi:peptidoglycan hydrolase-like protein with peptidoglycan-binding domain
VTASWKFVSNPGSGSQTVKLLQQKVGATADGIAGQGTVKALQTWLNSKGYSLTVDGYCGAATVKVVQQALNAGVFR